MSGPTDEDLITRSTDQDVVTRSPDQNIVTGSPFESVRFFGADELVAAGPAVHVKGPAFQIARRLDAVVSGSTEDAAGIPDRNIVTRPEQNCSLVARPIAHAVVAKSGADRPTAFGDHVVSGERRHHTPGAHRVRPWGPLVVRSRSVAAGETPVRVVEANDERTFFLGGRGVG